MSYIELHIHPTMDSYDHIKNQLLQWEDDSLMGIEEYALSEPQVDEILGLRSYSGGNLPQEVLNEVDDISTNNSGLKAFFKTDAKDAVIKFVEEIKINFSCDVQLNQKEDEDWNEEWKKHFQLIEINSDMSVIPLWEKNHPTNTKYPIFIYPGMGFGTGSHETTFLCLKLLINYRKTEKIRNVLDFGSGSGILAIGAKKIYPDAQLDLVDIDPVAHENALINIAENEIVNEDVKYLYPSQLPEKKYQIIFANILQNVLFQERDLLIQHLDDNGMLIISGLLRDQLEETSLFYQNSQNLILIECATRNDWGALIYKKRTV